MASEQLKRKLHIFADQPLKITPLGAGNEVGRSCVVVQYMGFTVMFDCGIHPAHKGIAALPYFDEIDPASIDIILITHFHLDHSAALPYFLSKTNFKGRVFMTHPTKSIYQLLLQDFIRVSSASNPDPLFDEMDLNNSLDRIETINFHQVVTHKGLKFWGYHAGHVLGAAMFMLEIAGVKILYTGDYSRKEDRHLPCAETPEVKPDVLIIESTYGIQRLEPVIARERKFTKKVTEILLRGGRCLIPVFALGRAQELFLIIEEYWKENPHLQSYPVYYASSLAKKCISVYQTYINMMNSRMQKQFDRKNPFYFEFIKYLRGAEDFCDVGPAVVFASPGMLQNGFSRTLFEEWCEEEKNGVIIPGYMVEGTLANDIMAEPKEVDSIDGRRLQLKMSVDYATFSAHADFNQTLEFIDALEPPHIVLVHGDSNEMSRLHNALTIHLKSKKTTISTPKNCQVVELEFGKDKGVNIVGKLARSEFKEGDQIEGVLVLKNHTMSVMEKEELSKFTPLTCASILQSVKIPFELGANALMALIDGIFRFEEISEFGNEKFKMKTKIDQILVSNVVKLLHNEESKFVVAEWVSSAAADSVADSIMAMLTNLGNKSDAEILLIKEKAKEFPLTKEQRREREKELIAEKMENILYSCFGEANVKPFGGTYGIGKNDNDEGFESNRNNRNDRNEPLFTVLFDEENFGNLGNLGNFGKIKVNVDKNFNVYGENPDCVRVVKKIVDGCVYSYQKVDFKKTSLDFENSEKFENNNSDFIKTKIMDENTKNLKV